MIIFYFFLTTLLYPIFIFGTSKPIKAIPWELATSPRTSFVEEEAGREISIAGGASINASDFSEIKFSNGSITLTNDDKEELNQLIEHTLFFSRTIYRIIILSWSHRDLSLNMQNNLSLDQNKLILNRNNSIKTYLENKFKIKFKFTLISMAEIKTNNLTRYDRESFKIKNSLIQAGLPTTSDELIYPSKANHSIIYIILN